MPNPSTLELEAEGHGGNPLWPELCALTNERDALLAEVADLRSQLETARALLADAKREARQHRAELKQCLTNTAPEDDDGA